MHRNATFGVGCSCVMRQSTRMERFEDLILEKRTWKMSLETDNWMSQYKDDNVEKKSKESKVSKGNVRQKNE